MSASIMSSNEERGDERSCTNRFHAFIFPRSLISATRAVTAVRNGCDSLCLAKTPSATCGLASVHPFTTQMTSQFQPRCANSPKMLCWKSESSVRPMTSCSFQAKMPMETRGPVSELLDSGVMDVLLQLFETRRFEPAGISGRTPDKGGETTLFCPDASVLIYY